MSIVATEGQGSSPLSRQVTLEPGSLEEIIPSPYRRPSRQTTWDVPSCLERGRTPARARTRQTIILDRSEVIVGTSHCLKYSTPPDIPIKRPFKRIMEFTELPFMILWVYSIYWLTIMCFSAAGTPRNTWLAAIVAGVLVGIALNANAYKYIVKPKSRSRSAVIRQRKCDTVSPTQQWPSNTSSFNSGTAREAAHDIAPIVMRFPRLVKGEFGNAQLEKKRKADFPHLQKSPVNLTPEEQSAISVPTAHITQLTTVGYEEDRLQVQATSNRHLAAAVAKLSSGIALINSSVGVFLPNGMQWTLDYGTMVRFFIIPFGVSSLAGVTSYYRHEYFLVFPRDPFRLMTALIVPAVSVTVLFLTRVTTLWYLNVQFRVKVLLFNGCLTY